MDSAPKSKRLYPGLTVEELYAAVKRPTISEAERDRLNLAIAQRDPGSSYFIPHFRVPQVGRPN
jgi:hypothetical protein